MAKRKWWDALDDDRQRDKDGDLYTDFASRVVPPDELDADDPRRLRKKAK